MRIRNAAVAGATALAIAFSGVANAEEPAQPAAGSSQPAKGEFGIDPAKTIDTTKGKDFGLNKGKELKNPTNSKSMLSSNIGDGLDKEVATNGNNIFGDHQDPNLPGWAKLFYASGILGAIGTVIGTIIAAVNYGLHEGLIKF
ncbi:hypothetical protein [Corynebacterium glucuronolyticum]|uniref:hypothetical protein n=1 Tax=Corynebacterium glucuronolyticum TaxID=39791 RepID=UPI00019C225B|nr:hypothetical protein [Corynebacterium glucuronolyticum]EEI27947.1 hypothetical protein HMPREF0294_0561 [Corynebacterium glucuronolyticum ATCC 51867]QRO81989.1 hypothetical protein I6J20_08930 [Corynebacterium glucuronolyticum]